MELAESRAARLVVIGFDGPTPTPEAAQLVARGVRSIILFARNAGARSAVSATAAACKALTSEPLLVCVDQEGGNTVRLTDGFDHAGWLNPSLRSSWHSIMSHLYPSSPIGDDF